MNYTKMINYNKINNQFKYNYFLEFKILKFYIKYNKQKIPFSK